MGSTKLKIGDSVIVKRGKKTDKGKIGKIQHILLKKNRIIVEQVHILKEYVRANPQKNIQGGIVDREGAIPISSVMYYCSDCEQGVRINISVKDNKKSRVCNKCKTVLD
jgi:large subunit ribosomal protein L24